MNRTGRTGLPPGRGWLTALALLLAALTALWSEEVPARRARPTPPASESARTAKGKSGPTSTRRTARHYRLTSRLRAPDVKPFARLSTTQADALRGAAAQAVMEAEVYWVPGSLLLRLPEEHPSGPADLLLDEETQQLVVFRTDSKRATPLPLRQLPDVLEGTAPSRRTDFELELDPAAKPEQHPPHRTRLLAGKLSYRLFPQRGHAISFRMRQQLALVFPDGPRPFFAHFRQPLLHLALPMLQTRRGVLVLESLAWRSGPPLHWSTTVEREGGADGPRTTISTMVQDLGWDDVPADLLAPRRQGYRRRTTLARPQRAGAQLLAAKLLSELRARPATGRLQVTNEAPCSMVLFVDGVPLGWISPGRNFSFTGLADGHYRIHAASVLGRCSWGPRDIYVPGPLTLH